jgi:hypothetical protein
MDSPTRDTQVMNGSYGDANVAVMFVDFSGEAAATVVDMGALPPTAEVIDVVIKHEALGAGVTLKAGHASIDASVAADDGYFMSGVDAAAAGRADSVAQPVEFSTESLITLTTGGAAATGRATVLVTYKYHGA